MPIYDGWCTIKAFQTTHIHGYITGISTFHDPTFIYVGQILTIPAVSLFPQLQEAGEFFPASCNFVYFNN